MSKFMIYTRKGFIRKFLKRYISKTGMPYDMAKNEADYYADSYEPDGDFSFPEMAADEAISVLCN